MPIEIITGDDFGPAGAKLSANQALTEFERLRRFVLYHLGGFTLGLVRVNDPGQRDGVIASRADSLAADGARLIRVDLATRNPDDLRQALQTDPAAWSYILRVAQGEQKGSESIPTAVAIVVMEHLIEAEAGSSGRPPFAAAINAERDVLRTALPLPIMIFLTDHAMDRLDLTAPDFFLTGTAASFTCDHLPFPHSNRLLQCQAARPRYSVTDRSELQEYRAEPKLLNSGGWPAQKGAS